MSYVKMPFGKYKGIYLENIPISYLAYCLDEFDLTTNLDEAIRECLFVSLGFNDRPEANTNINSIYIKLAKKYHPDKGGNTIAMQAINEFRDLIKNSK